MKKILFVGLICVLYGSPTLSAQKLSDIFRDQEWLIDQRENSDLVILHVNDRKNYEAHHLPGAQYVGFRDFVVVKDSLSSELPPLAHMDSLLRSKGITNQSTIVLYYGGDIFAPTFRLYFTLDYLGLGKQSFILDGGLKSWKKNGHMVVDDSSYVTPTPFGGLTLKPNPSLLKSKDEVVQGMAAKHTQIVDARRPNFFSGETDGDGYYKRSGHIKSAKNITWTQLLDKDQMLKSPEDLEAYFTEAGIKPKDKVINYCHIGLRATVLYTIAKGLGHKAYLYDGSYNEWDRLGEAYPMEKGN